MELVGESSCRIRHHLLSSTQENDNLFRQYDNLLVIRFKSCFTLVPPPYSSASATINFRTFQVPLRLLLDPSAGNAMVAEMLARSHVPTLDSLVDGILGCACRAASGAAREEGEALKGVIMSVEIDLSVNQFPGDYQERHRETETPALRLVVLRLEEMNPSQVKFLSTLFRSQSEDTDVVVEFEPRREKAVAAVERIRVGGGGGSGGDGGEEEKPCAVCLEDIRVGSEATRLPCQHYFHGKCIFLWLISTRSRRSCPLCRFQLPRN